MPTPVGNTTGLVGKLAFMCPLKSISSTLGGFCHGQNVFLFHSLWVYYALAMNSYGSVTSDTLGDGASSGPFLLVGILVALVAALFAVALSVSQASANVGTVLLASATADGQAPAGQSGEDGSAPAVDDEVAEAEESEVEVEAQDEPTPAQVIETEVLRAELASSREQVVALQEQLGILQQTLIGVQAESDEPVEANSSIARWRIGYSLGGGERLASFENTILPCESGTQPDPDTAVSHTDDWGRAQINRPVWKDRFESLTGVNFEENITDPVLNGFMAAHVEQEQGLTAWTCWRNR